MYSVLVLDYVNVLLVLRTTNVLLFQIICYIGRRVSRGGGTPLEIEKNYILLLFSRKYYFLSCFLSWAPPPKILKSKKKNKKQKAFRFWAPPPYEFLDTRLYWPFRSNNFVTLMFESAM